MEKHSDSLLLWPFFIYGIAVLVIVVGMLVVSYLLGERHKDPATNEAYESGILATGSARILFPIHFYIIAMFFVIFDIEAVFIIAWAISIKALGWSGYMAILLFIGILLCILFYEWKIGALDFGPDGKRILKVYQKRKRQNI
jgi:NADH-quinone oxidoreductase subunit A